MTQFHFFGLYLALGLVGAISHYAVKRFWNREIDCDFIHYVTFNRSATTKAVGTILTAEYALTLSVSAISLQSVATALLAGYTSDSVLNRADK